MAAVLSSGVTTEGWLNTGTALLVAILSGAVAIGIAFMQGRTNRKARADAATMWQEQAEELRDRMAKQYESQLASQSAQYEAQIKRIIELSSKDRDEH